MPQFERRLYDPAEDAGLEDDTAEEEGSRLPLLIVIALVVLASFAGVVWIAYSQGVERGKQDAPRIIAAQPGERLGSEPKYSDLNIYKPAKREETAKSAAPPSAPPKSAQTAPRPLTQEPVQKPAPQAILPPPVPNPTVKTPAKPAVAAQANTPNSQPASALSNSQAASAAPKPATTAMNNPPGAAPVKVAPPRPLTGAPHSIMPNMAAPPAARPATTVPPAPAPQQSANAQKRATAAAAPTANTGAQGFVAQIGSYTSEAEANASWQTYKAGHPSVAGYAPDVQKADLGSRGTWYRLRVGPFATMQDAAAACAKLKAQGSSCLPTKR
ncbi:MAG: SPOR domain-containing protein [Alphaproteobacteria bacterium]|nr:SPOR domain-containing protein [Alphaproteobacteria bacterium]